MQRWLTLYTKPHKETQVHGVLTAREIEVYLPLIQQYNSHRRRKEPTPFFPCYLFVRIDSDSPQYLSLSWTPGTRGIVKFGGGVAWVPDEVIARIEERLPQLEQSGHFDRNKFHHGDLVRIKTGPLKDLEAIFDRNLSKEGRVKVLLELLGRLTACNIESDWLEKIG